MYLFPRVFSKLNGHCIISCYNSNDEPMLQDNFCQEKKSSLLKLLKASAE